MEQPDLAVVSLEICHLATKSSSGFVPFSLFSLVKILDPVIKIEKLQNKNVVGNLKIGAGEL
jgi:hypothetical protein